MRDDYHVPLPLHLHDYWLEPVDDVLVALSVAVSEAQLVLVPLGELLRILLLNLCVGQLFAYAGVDLIKSLPANLKRKKNNLILCIDKCEWIFKITDGALMCLAVATVRLSSEVHTRMLSMFMLLILSPNFFAYSSPLFFHANTTLQSQTMQKTLKTTKSTNLGDRGLSPPIFPLTLNMDSPCLVR